MKGVKKASIVVGFGALTAFGASVEAATIPDGPYVGIVGGYQSTNVETSASSGGDTLKIDSAVEGRVRV